MKFEELPSELWLLILSHLSSLEVLYSFQNIDNARIQSILTTIYSIENSNNDRSSCFHLSLAQIPLSLYNFAMSNIVPSYSNVIHSLTLSNEQTPGQINHFLQQYSFEHHFKHLKCLRLIEPSSPEINVIINDITNIEILRIQSKHMYSFSLDIVEKILYSKLSLNDCYLSRFCHDFISYNRCSFIQTLRIDSCNYSCCIDLLNYFCSLRKLSIHTLTMPENANLLEEKVIDKPILIKDLKLRAYSIPFCHLKKLCSAFSNIERFSLSIICDEGFDYVNSDQWQMILTDYWPLLKKFQFYSELWHLTPADFDDLYPHLLSFQNNPFWTERHMEFITDFYQDKSDLHLIFYSNPYPDRNFSNEWGNRIDIALNSTKKKCLSSIRNVYENVNQLFLTIYNNKQIRYELDKFSHYFPYVETLAIKFEQNVSNTLFRLYVETITNLNFIKSVTICGKCHNPNTLYELISRLPNMTKLTITNNHRILIKQLFHERNRELLLILSQRLQHFNLLYDGVISHVIVETIRYNFSCLETFSVCLPHFEDFRNVIPGFILNVKSLRYLHIGLEGDNDKKSFTTQDMHGWFRRHHISRDFELYIDTYTNSIHIWL